MNLYNYLHLKHMRITNIATLCWIAISDLLITKKHSTKNIDHLGKAIQWLSLAQDNSADGGVSEGFHFIHGWLPSYPETTGYIIETFFDYYHYCAGDESIKNRAIRMADWLLSIQHQDGAIPDSYFKKKMVFDTGQVIFGFVRVYEETGEQKYKDAAILAAEWLVNQQEPDGSWVRHAVDNIPHTYYSRVAWSLLKVHAITSNDVYKEACTRNIEWCLQQQDDKGWFDRASFNVSNHSKPFTHTIAYTLRGILESGIYLKNNVFIDAVRISLDNLVDTLPDSGFVCGTYARKWNGNNKFSCLTGNAQLAIILNKFYKVTGEKKYHRQATVINNYLKNMQEFRTINSNIHGALAGSYPIWGEYIHYCYPNWAAKFYAESFMIELENVNEKQAIIKV